MTGTDLLAFLPLIALSVFIVIITLVIPFKRSHALTLMLTLAALFVCFILLEVPLAAAAPSVQLLLTLDGYSLFFVGLFLIAAAVVSLLNYGYMEGRKNIKEESYLLLLMATLGCCVIVCSNHFASVFLGVELLSVSLYVLISYLRGTNLQLEAAIKYLILAAVSVSILLFGMALIYVDMGTMDFYEIAALLVTAKSTGFMLMIGSVLFLIGIGFKLALVPFHLWTPDVYQGAPAPMAAFIATSSKGAVLAFLLRFLIVVRLENLGAVALALTVIAIMSMIVGNVLALMQRNLKRLLAYSSISHMGYLLVALMASGEQAIFAVIYYVTAYFITILAAFGVITVLSSKEDDLDDLIDYRGLAYQHFWLAALLTGALLSLAGIPITAGFIGKFLLVSAGVGARLWLLLIVLVVSSAIGLFYYLRVILLLFSKPARGEYESFAFTPRIAPPSFSTMAGIALTALSFLLILLGILPAPLMRLIEVLAL